MEEPGPREQAAEIVVWRSKLRAEVRAVRQETPVQHGGVLAAAVLILWPRDLRKWTAVELTFSCWASTALVGM